MNRVRSVLREMWQAEEQELEDGSHPWNSYLLMSEQEVIDRFGRPTGVDVGQNGTYSWYYESHPGDDELNNYLSFEFFEGRVFDVDY